jgi:hypothetical protein
MRTSDRWYHRIIRDSIRSDLKNKFAVDYSKYVTTPFLQELQNKQQNLCHICLDFMDWIERRSSKTGLTLDRLDNDLPHYRDNVKLACKSCNSARMSKDKQRLKRCFRRWYKRTFDIPHIFSNRRCSLVT